MSSCSALFPLSVLLLVAACGGGEPDPGSDCGPQAEPTLEIGTGLKEFLPLQDGDPLPLIRGSQGGVHLELALRARGIDAGDLLGGEFQGSIDGENLATARPWVDFRCNKKVDTLDAWGFILVYEVDPPDVYGLNTLVTARVTDLLGTSVETSINLQITEP